MNTKCLRACLLSIAAGGLVSGCTISFDPNGHVIVQPPVIAVEAGAAVMVPDAYAWDGVEYVGFVGGQYMYLGPGNVWLVCEPFRLERFHGWERYHQDRKSTRLNS